MRKIAIGLLITAVCILQNVYGQPFGNKDGCPSVCNADTVFATGIDLSHYNNEPDWDALEVDFVFLKATEGGTYTDPTFKKRLEACRKAGIPVGAYHYYRGKVETEAEFGNYINTVGKNIDLKPVVDLEKKPDGMSAGEFQGKLSDFLNRMTEYYGVKPILYTKQAFFDAYLKDMLDENPEGEEWILWIGDTDMKYNELMQRPAIHQEAIKEVKGIKGRVDFNALYRPMETIMLPIQ